MKEYTIIEPCTVNLYYYVEAENMKDAIRQWSDCNLTSDRQSSVETDFRDKGLRVVEMAEDGVTMPCAIFPPFLVQRIIRGNEG